MAVNVSPDSENDLVTFETPPVEEATSGAVQASQRDPSRECMCIPRADGSFVILTLDDHQQQGPHSLVTGSVLQTWCWIDSKGAVVSEQHSAATPPEAAEGDDVVLTVPDLFEYPASGDKSSDGSTVSTPQAKQKSWGNTSSDGSQSTLNTPQPRRKTRSNISTSSGSLSVLDSPVSFSRHKLEASKLLHKFHRGKNVKLEDHKMELGSKRKNNKRDPKLKLWLEAQGSSLEDDSAEYIILHADIDVPRKYNRVLDIAKFQISVTTLHHSASNTPLPLQQPQPQNFTLIQENKQLVFELFSRSCLEQNVTVDLVVKVQPVYFMPPEEEVLDYEITNPTDSVAFVNIQKKQEPRTRMTLSVVAEQSVSLTNEEKTFEWEEHGLTLHVPKNSLQEGCSQIRVSLVIAQSDHSNQVQDSPQSRHICYGLKYIDGEQPKQWTIKKSTSASQSQEPRSRMTLSVVAEQSVSVTNQEKTFEWEEHGLTLHVPENSLPADCNHTHLTVIIAKSYPSNQTQDSQHSRHILYGFKCIDGEQPKLVALKTGCRGAVDISPPQGKCPPPPIPIPGNVTPMTTGSHQQTPCSVDSKEMEINLPVEEASEQHSVATTSEAAEGGDSVVAESDLFEYFTPEDKSRDGSKSTAGILTQLEEKGQFSYTNINPLKNVLQKIDQHVLVNWFVNPFILRQKSLVKKQGTQSLPLDNLGGYSNAYTNGSEEKSWPHATYTGGQCYRLWTPRSFIRPSFHRYRSSVSEDDTAFRPPLTDLLALPQSHSTNSAGHFHTSNHTSTLPSHPYRKKQEFVSGSEMSFSLSARFPSQTNLASSSLHETTSRPYECSEFASHVHQPSSILPSNNVPQAETPVAQFAISSSTSGKGPPPPIPILGNMTPIATGSHQRTPCSISSKEAEIDLPVEEASEQHSVATTSEAAEGGDIVLALSSGECPSPPIPIPGNMTPRPMDISSLQQFERQHSQDTQSISASIGQQTTVHSRETMVNYIHDHQYDKYIKVQPRLILNLGCKNNPQLGFKLWPCGLEDDKDESVTFQADVYFPAKCSSAVFRSIVRLTVTATDNQTGEQINSRCVEFSLHSRSTTVYDLIQHRALIRSKSVRIGLTVEAEVVEFHPHPTSSATYFHTRNYTSTLPSYHHRDQQECVSGSLMSFPLSAQLPSQTNLASTSLHKTTSRPDERSELASHVHQPSLFLPLINVPPAETPAAQFKSCSSTSGKYPPPPILIPGNVTPMATGSHQRTPRSISSKEAEIDLPVEEASEQKSVATTSEAAEGGDSAVAESDVFEYFAPEDKSGGECPSPPIPIPGNMTPCPTSTVASCLQSERQHSQDKQSKSAPIGQHEPRVLPREVSLPADNTPHPHLNDYPMAYTTCNQLGGTDSMIGPPKYLPADERIVPPCVKPTATLHHCTSQGMEYNDELNGFKLKIPVGAIPEGESFTIDIGVALYGPFQYPEGLRPVSPVFWICVRNKKHHMRFLKPVSITIQHCLKVDREEDVELLGLTFLQGDHEMNSDRKYPFYATKGESRFKANTDCGTLYTYHFCYKCITSKESKFTPEKANFCLFAAIPHTFVYDESTYTYFFVCFLLEACIETVGRQLMDMTGHVYHEIWEKFQFSTSPPAILIEYPDDLPGGWQIGLRSKAEITLNDVDFWPIGAEQLKVMEKKGMYPPRFRLVIDGSKTTQKTRARIRFTGTTTSLVHDILLSPAFQKNSTQQEPLHSPVTGATPVTSVTPTTPMTLKNLMNFVAARIPSRWKHFGIQLDIPPEEFDTYPSHDWRECFTLVFRYWEKNASPDYTWETVIEILESPTINEKRLAREIRDKTATHRDPHTP